MTELFTLHLGRPLPSSFQQSLGVKLWHCGQKASGESLGGKNPSWIRMLYHPVPESYGIKR